jgi:ubiquinone/menaquinone biosynthesis C-methylase UbiE
VTEKQSNPGEPGVKHEDAAAVFDRAAQTYERIGPQFFSHFGRRLVELIGIQPGSRVLDVASGAGAILLPAAEHVGPKGLVVGIDLADSMVERLGQEIAHRGVLQAQARLMDAQHLEFPDASFDYVLCGFALDMFPDPERALSEFRRVLLSGGRLGLTLSPGWWWEGDERWGWHAKLLRWLGAQVQFGPRRFESVGEVEDALRVRGFTDVTTLKERFDLTWADADEWWRWGWSHGWRRVLEAMQRDKLERYRRACLQELRALARSGGIRGRLEVILAAGTKADPRPS